MKRSDALAPLSRDHHVGLVAAQRLRRVTDATAPGARDDFLAYWREHGQRHFRVEEDVLLPWFARHGDAGHEAVVRALVDHVAVRAMALQLESAAAVPAERLHELGELLHGHIRHEERTLFPLIEAAVPGDELPALASRVEHAERDG